MSRRRRSPGRDATWLVAGTALSALAIYVFLGLGTRTLGAADFAPVSVLWSMWAISAAAFTFPVQHWIIQTVEATGHEDAVWGALPRILLSSIAIGAVTMVVTALSSRPLFGASGLAFPAMCALLPLGSVAMGVNRGVMSARGQFRGTATAILGENLVRVALALLVGPSLGSVGHGWLLIAGFVVAGAFPRSFRRPSPSSSSIVASIGLLGGLTGANLISQGVLTVGPVLVSVLGGTPTSITALFSVLALLRTPYTVALGASVRMTAPLTRSVRGGDTSAVRRRMRLLTVTALALAATAGILGVVVVPMVVRWVFDVPDVLSNWDVALLTAGSVIALGNLLQMLLLLAMERGGPLVRSWGAAIVAGGLALSWPGPSTTRVAVAFVVAECVALVMMTRVSEGVRLHEPQTLEQT